MEILGNAARISNEIKGSDIEPGKTVTLAQYSYGTTVIEKDAQSILNLFKLLCQGENHDGLQINESKSELLYGWDHYVFARITFLTSIKVRYFSLLSESLLFL